MWRTSEIQFTCVRFLQCTNVKCTVQLASLERREVWLNTTVLIINIYNSNKKCFEDEGLNFIALLEVFLIKYT